MEVAGWQSARGCPWFPATRGPLSRASSRSSSPRRILVSIRCPGVSRLADRERRQLSTSDVRTSLQRRSSYRLARCGKARQSVDVRTMPGVRYKQLVERAAETFGYLTAEDAREIGVPVGTLNALARRGQLEHLARGIYRVPLIPPGRLDQYMLATLWPDGRGTISHDSALELYGLVMSTPPRFTSLCRLRTERTGTFLRCTCCTTRRSHRPISAASRVSRWCRRRKRFARLTRSRCAGRCSSRPSTTAGIAAGCAAAKPTGCGRTRSAGEPRELQATEPSAC